MCDKCECTKQEERTDDPKQCTPEQIAKCHPESKDHPCEEKKEESTPDA